MTESDATSASLPVPFFGIPSSGTGRQRLEKLRQSFSGAHIHALLVTHLPHVRYLTGFSGSNGVCLVTNRTCYFLSDGRYREQVRQEVERARVVIAKGTLFSEISSRKLLKGIERVGVESHYLSVASLETLKKLFPRVKFVSTRSLIENIASVKDELEIGYIKKAVAITDRVFSKILNILKAGVSEQDIAAEISYLHKKFGAEADAFEPIVASGTRGALPHARPSAKKIRNGELVTLDFGCRYNGYHSDLTRTIAVGKPSAKARTMYQVVLDAQQRALDAVASSMKAQALDTVARSFIRKKGFGKYFTHSLGHGLGLEIHEVPRISALSKDILCEGNVITIEPGIYIPHFGGVRIEDDVVIRYSSCEILNKSPKELIVV
ncbi:MAG: aminopeptidase P family protein [Ignavibacteriales bacterium]|nr:aminopeptidase P family protein [Ignavibacteriales bacterium]